MTLGEVLRLAVDVLGAGENGERRALDEGQLEVAVLDRDRPRRSFRRIVGPLLTRLLGEPPRDHRRPPAGRRRTETAAAAADPTTTGEPPERSGPRDAAGLSAAAHRIEVHTTKAAHRDGGRPSSCVGAATRPAAGGASAARGADPVARGAALVVRRLVGAVGRALAAASSCSSSPCSSSASAAG